MKVAAGIVLFNPNCQRLIENLQAIIPQVGQVFLVDNGSDNLSEIKELLQKYPSAKLLINTANGGIAKALNQLLAAAGREGYSWLLTLDQDSVVEAELIKNYQDFCNKKRVERLALVTCQIKDRHYGINPRSAFAGEYRLVNKCITSACLTNIAAAKAVGGFAEEMFIDYVDFEFCFKLTEAGYKLAQLSYVGLLHELGQKARRHTFLGISAVATNHSPERVYYFARNLIYTLRLHPRINRCGELKSLIFKAATITLYEKNKRAKLKAIIRGIHDGRKMALRQAG